MTPNSWFETIQSLWNLDGRLADVGVVSLALIMVVSLLSSLLMAQLYVVFYKGRGTGSQIHRAFPLIGVSVTAIFLAIQFSLPLSLGLLGALSIVRFRTPVKEPEEVGFILLVIATSLCVATFSLIFLAIVISVAVAGLFLLRAAKGPLSRRANSGVAIVSMPADVYAASGEALLELLSSTFSPEDLESITNRDDVAVITYGFSARDREKAVRLQWKVQEISRSARTTVYMGAALP